MVLPYTQPNRIVDPSAKLGIQYQLQPIPYIINRARRPNFPADNPAILATPAAALLPGIPQLHIVPVGSPLVLVFPKTLLTKRHKIQPLITQPKLVIKEHNLQHVTPIINI